MELFLFHFVSVCFRHLVIFITHVICCRYFQHRINKFLPLLGCLFIRSFFCPRFSLLRLRCHMNWVFLWDSLFPRTLPLHCQRLSTIYTHFTADLLRLFWSFIHTQCIWSSIQWIFDVTHIQFVTNAVQLQNNASMCLLECNAIKKIHSHIGFAFVHLCAFASETCALKRVFKRHEKWKKSAANKRWASRRKMAIENGITRVGALWFVWRAEPIL